MFNIDNFVKIKSLFYSIQIELEEEKAHYHEIDREEYLIVFHLRLKKYWSESPTIMIFARWENGSSKMLIIIKLLYDIQMTLNAV